MKSYGFLSFAKNIGENISKILSGKYGQKLLDHAKQSATDAFKTSSKIFIQKTAEGTGDLIGNKVADKIPRVSKSLTQNNLETQYISPNKYISPELRQKTNNDLRLKENSYISRSKYII